MFLTVFLHETCLSCQTIECTCWYVLGHINCNECVLECYQLVVITKHKILPIGITHLFIIKFFSEIVKS